MPKNPRTYYKAVGELNSGNMSSMKFQTTELEKILRVDPESPMIKNLRLAKNSNVDIDKVSADRVKLLTKEVLRACNVIRPSVADLTQLPKARELAKSALRLEQKNRQIQSKQLDMLNRNLNASSTNAYNANHNHSQNQATIRIDEDD